VVGQALGELPGACMRLMDDSVAVDSIGKIEQRACPQPVAPASCVSKGNQDAGCGERRRRGGGGPPARATGALADDIDRLPP
jgi:hypothetical protein